MSSRPEAGEAEAAEFDPIRGVLFDATGTLIETRERVGTVYARLAIPFGVDLPAWRIDDGFRRIVASAPPRVFADREASEIPDCERQWWQRVVRSAFLAADSTIKFSDFAAFFGELYDYYQTEDAWVLRPFALDCLIDLKRSDYRTGVVSNFDQRLPIILQALGVDELLDVVMTPGRCLVEKPDPRIFEAALELLQLPAHSVVYVGDDPIKDLAAAERAGLRSIDVCALDSFAELDSRIQGLNAARVASISSKAR
jgi:putative hydrolase of the HAD superfamily